MRERGYGLGRRGIAAHFSASCSKLPYQCYHVLRKEGEAQPKTSCGKLVQAETSCLCWAAVPAAAQPETSSSKAIQAETSCGEMHHQDWKSRQRHFVKLFEAM